MRILTVAAIQIERRKACLALFAGFNIEFIYTRELSSKSEQASKSLVGFVRKVLSDSGVDYVALELNPVRCDAQVGVLSRGLIAALREDVIAISTVPTESLLYTFAQPRLERRQQLRLACERIFPAISLPKPGAIALDAAAVGLHVQIERHLSLIPTAP
jgi:hypothetical protein